jgi:hypothetical protein
MSGKNRSRNDGIRKRIDKLLDSSLDLDQIALLLSQMLPEAQPLSRRSSSMLHKIELCATKNAKNIQDARELVLAIH